MFLCVGIVSLEVERLTCAHRLVGTSELVPVQRVLFVHLCVDCIRWAFTSSMVRIQGFIVEVVITGGWVVWRVLGMPFHVLLAVYGLWR